MREYTNNDPFNGLGLLVNFKERDDFLKIKETLTRIGNEEQNNKSTPTLFQSCYILHKRGKYAIIHYNELLKLDGENVTVSSDDEESRNTIVKLLSEWNLLKLDNPELLNYLKMKPTHKLTFVSFKNKKDPNKKYSPTTMREQKEICACPANN